MRHYQLGSLTDGELSLLSAEDHDRITTHRSSSSSNYSKPVIFLMNNNNGHHNHFDGGNSSTTMISWCRGNKLKLFALLMMLLLMVQYVFGASIYNIRIFDYNIAQIYVWSSTDGGQQQQQQQNNNGGINNNAAVISRTTISSNSKSIDSNYSAILNSSSSNWTTTTILDSSSVSVSVPIATTQTIRRSSSSTNSSSSRTSISSNSSGAFSWNIVETKKSSTGTNFPSSSSSSGSGSRSSTSTKTPATVVSSGGSTTGGGMMTSSTTNNLADNTTSSINSTTGANSTNQLCPLLPPGLVGPIAVWFDHPSYEKLEAMYSNLEMGGHGKPEECVSRHKVAIIIPYRDRDMHLRGFLHNIHSLLKKQQLDYAIYIVEQVANQTFNRAKLMNVGFVEAMKQYDWQCAIFHDVDLLPEDDRNIYSCPEQPRHMSVAIDKFSYRLPYKDIFGGISALTSDQFRKLNGFSNDYWGWGGEDDDMASRVKLVGFQISRYPANVARYKMIKHTRDEQNAINTCRYNLMYKVKRRWTKDGLSNLAYEVVSLEKRRLFTKVLVDLLETESKRRLASENVCVTDSSSTKG